MCWVSILCKRLNFLLVSHGRKLLVLAKMKSPCQVMTRSESWDARLQFYKAAKVFSCVREFNYYVVIDNGRAWFVYPKSRLLTTEMFSKYHKVSFHISQCGPEASLCTFHYWRGMVVHILTCINSTVWLYSVVDIRRYVCQNLGAEDFDSPTTGRIYYINSVTSAWSIRCCYQLCHT